MAVVSLLVTACLVAVTALAICECGYSTEVYGQPSAAVFTDLLETDFTSCDLALADDSDWASQDYSLSATDARGRYGMTFLDSAVRLQTGAGLCLRVGSQPSNDRLPCAEYASVRDDTLYGSFRVGMTLTGQPGTCSAFFWYFNDTQEIDMEFLSHQYNRDKNIFPVNLSLQTRQSVQDGFSTANTPYFETVNLPFDPSVGVHEYRIDFTPDVIVFYADGFVLSQMTGDAIPSTPGSLLLSHWSNGNGDWSGGPPPQDAVMQVAYVKSYFNSSSPDRAADWAGRCTDPSADAAVCAIPGAFTDVRPAFSSATAASSTGFFFIKQANMSNDQSVYRPPPGLAGPDNSSDGRAASGAVTPGQALAGFWTWTTSAALLGLGAWVTLF